LDLRPRVKPFSLTNRSPFEYEGRELSVLGKYSSYVLVPNRNLILTYDYYLPRVDVISLNREGKFEVIKGIPSDDLKVPALKSNTIDIATVLLPPYLYSIRDAIVNMAIHKRYRMSDISLLENRIEKIEMVTSLNLLEARTDSIVIRDVETGLDRFKSGFFADNFTTDQFSDTTNLQFRSTIYKDTGILSANVTTKNLELQIGSELISGFSTTFNPSADSSFLSDVGSPGIKVTGKGKIVTLNYSEVPYISQPFATKETKISNEPVIYNGIAALSPSQDIWYEEKLIERNTSVEGTTTIANTPTVENQTFTVNIQGPNIIRYVDPPQQNPPSNPPGGYNRYATSSSSRSSSSPSPVRYEGIATGYIPSTNSYGTVDQNMGGYDPSAGTNRTTPSIGLAGVERARAMGYGDDEIRSWISRSGAEVAGDASIALGLG
jgi:hypothetical protein